MSELLLVRHGQAGASADAYDQLSPLGREQARRLGVWLLAHAREFGAIAVGQMRRQRETLQEIETVYADAGRPLPAPEVLPGLDEYGFVEVVRAFATRHPQHPEVVATQSLPHGVDKRQWLALLRSALSAWTRGELTGIGEDFVSFRARTDRALEQLSARLESGPVLAVTSGGVMGQIAQRILGFPDTSLIDVNFSLLNSSLCEYRLTRNGLKLVSLNALPHLSAPEDKGLVTVV